MARRTERFGKTARNRPAPAREQTHRKSPGGYKQSHGAILSVSGNSNSIISLYTHNLINNISRCQCHSQISDNRAPANYLPRSDGPTADARARRKNARLLDRPYARVQARSRRSHLNRVPVNIT